MKTSSLSNFDWDEYTKREKKRYSPLDIIELDIKTKRFVFNFFIEENNFENASVALEAAILLMANKIHIKHCD